MPTDQPADPKASAFDPGTNQPVTRTPKPPLSCDEISRRLYELRMSRQHLFGSGRGGFDDSIMEIVEALNHHHLIIATAFREISEHDPRAITVPTFRNLSQMLVRD